MTVLLGVDTGGTYTDAVLWIEAPRGVAGQGQGADHPRTIWSVGIRAAVDAVMAAAGVASGWR